MNADVLIFLISAVAVIAFLSVVVVVFKYLRQKSTLYSKLKEKDNRKEKFQFVVPTHRPKTFTLQDYGNDNNSTNGGEIDATMIDPELYQDALEEYKDVIATAPGRLCFSVRYETDEEKLVIDLVCAERIRQRRKSSTTSSATPYVKICLLPDKKKKLQTKARQKTSNPLFNESFFFFCPFPELKERTLRFTICDFDRFSRQSAVGKVLFSLEENYEQILQEEGCVEIWREIEDCGNWEVENPCVGEILFSLQYLPAAKRLAISIMKGKEFGVEGSLKKPSVVVKISMIVMIGGKTVHVRKTTKKHSVEPVFNESFHFDLPDDLLDHSSLVLTVKNNKETIGKIVVGPVMFATGTGLYHWNSMLSSPRNAVAMWHTLS